MHDEDASRFSTVGIIVPSHTQKLTEMVKRSRELENPELKLALRGTGLTQSCLEVDPSIIYVLQKDSRIIYCNPAWDKFALENEGDTLVRANVLGWRVKDVLPQPLVKFYQDAFKQVLATGSSWGHDYECSAPGLYRLFRMQILRLAGAHLLVMNSLRVEGPHLADVLGSEEDATYIDEHGILTLCCNCRRARRVDSAETEVWNWVPRFIAKPPDKVSHGLCKICLPSFLQA